MYAYMSSLFVFDPKPVIDSNVFQ